MVAALSEMGPASLETLVVRVYDDVSPALHPIAKHSLNAHLLKLLREQRASEHEGHWQTGGGA